jgi:hypothetical protein
MTFREPIEPVPSSFAEGFEIDLEGSVMIGVRHGLGAQWQ